MSWRLTIFVGIGISLFSFLNADTQNAYNLENMNAIIPAYEQYIKDGMKETHNPGIAIAIIIDNQVAYIKGFGEKRAGENSPITTDTVFQVASVSKPLTSTVIAALVGDHVVSWDSRVNQLDSSFRLKNPWISSEVTIADLLSHRSGLPEFAGDQLEDLGFDQAVILQKLSLEPLSHFRTKYQYTNFGYTEAALAASKAAGLPWDVVVRQKLIEPLGMHSTSTKYADYLNHPDRADLHAIQNGSATPLYKQNPDAQTPAGGFSTSINDFSKWMILQLTDGNYNGKQIIPKKAIQETHMPMITKEADQFYGLGWVIEYGCQKEKILNHSGMFVNGARTLVKLIPQSKFGIAVFSNAAVTGLPEALISIFIDLMEKKPIEKQRFEMWDNRFLAFFGDRMTSLPSPQYKSEALPLNAYTGLYSNEYFGELKVALKEDKLVFSLGPKPDEFMLTHLNRDVFSFENLEENMSTPTPVVFTVDEKGIAQQVVINAFNKNGLGVFRKSK